MCEEYNKENKALQDYKKSGKLRNWREKKIGSWHLRRSYERLGEDKKAYRTSQCASYLDFKVDSDGNKKLHRAYFCQDKLCPICASRRSDKLYGQVSKVINYIDDHERYRYVFLSLTVRNVPGEELSAEITKIFAGFNLLTKRKAFRLISKGWIRQLEVTHNWAEDTYHPHLHIIIAVKEEYFTEYENYIEHWDWVELWKSCMKLDYDPYVDVRKVRKDKSDKDAKIKTISYKKAIAEITKYAAKSNDYLVKWKDREFLGEKFGLELESAKQCEDMTDKAVSTLSKALFHRRLIAFGGHLDTVRKILKLDDVESGDLVNTDNDNDNDKKQETPIEVVRYRWSNKLKNYFIDEDFMAAQAERLQREQSVNRGPSP